MSAFLLGLVVGIGAMSFPATFFCVTTYISKMEDVQKKTEARILERVSGRVQSLRKCLSGIVEYSNACLGDFGKNHAIETIKGFAYDAIDYDVRTYEAEAGVSK